MSDVPIKFDYTLGDKVVIKALKVDGIIDGLLNDSLGNMYRVAYWYDGERKSTWVYVNEIEVKL